jgi:hypothetical protein
MDVTLQYFDGCPNWQHTEGLLREALRDLGRAEARVYLRRVDSPEDAERLGFHGSPTILIDGADPFAEDDAAVGLMCRVYSTPNGLAGSPTIEQLAQAIQSRT